MAIVRRTARRPRRAPAADDAHRPFGAAARLAASGRGVPGVPARSPAVGGSALPRACRNRLARGRRRAGRIRRRPARAARREHDHHATGRTARGRRAQRAAQHRSKTRSGSHRHRARAIVVQGAGSRGLCEPGAISRRTGGPAGSGGARVRQGRARAGRARIRLGRRADPRAERGARPRCAARVPAARGAGDVLAVPRARRHGARGAGAPRGATRDRRPARAPSGPPASDPAGQHGGHDAGRRAAAGRARCAAGPPAGDRRPACRGRRRRRSRQSQRRRARLGRFVRTSVDGARRRRRASAPPGRFDAEALPVRRGDRGTPAHGGIAARGQSARPAGRRRVVDPEEPRPRPPRPGQRQDRARVVAERARRPGGQHGDAAGVRAHAGRLRAEQPVAPWRALRAQPCARIGRGHAARTRQCVSCACQPRPRFPGAGRSGSRRAAARRPAARGADAAGVSGAGSRGGLRRRRHPVGPQCARRHVRLGQPARHALLGGGQDRHQQGPARQLVHRIHRAAHGRGLGGQRERSADARRVRRSRRGTGVGTARRSAAALRAVGRAAGACRARAHCRPLFGRTGTVPRRVVPGRHGNQRDRGARFATRHRDRLPHPRHGDRTRPRHPARQPAPEDAGPRRRSARALGTRRTPARQRRGVRVVPRARQAHAASARALAVGVRSGRVRGPRRKLPGCLSPRSPKSSPS